MSACAATAGAPVPLVHRVWPPPPAPAEVRWLGEYPDPGRQRARKPSFWKRLAGVDERPAPAVPELARPFGLAAVDGGFIVVDPDGRQVTRVAWPAGSSSKLGCAGREWVMPLGVAAADGSVYIADGGARLVLRVPARGGPCVAIGAGALERPSGVAVAGGRVYVVDPPRHTVDVFSPDGARLGSFGARGDATGPGLNYPTGIAAAPDGTLLVVDALNFRVSRFTAEGAYLASVGEPGDGNGAFGRPKAVATDAIGRLYVSDAQNDVVVILWPSGGFALAVGGSGGGPGDLSLPAGVAVGERFLYVADSYNHRVQVYELARALP